MKRHDVYELVDSERDYQEKKWNTNTTSSRGIHSPTEWLVYMQDYLNEAFYFASRHPEPEASKFVMDNIRKITGMGVAAMEQNETNSR